MPFSLAWPEHVIVQPDIQVGAIRLLIRTDRAVLDFLPSAAANSRFSAARVLAAFAESGPGLGKLALNGDLDSIAAAVLVDRHRRLVGRFDGIHSGQYSSVNGGFPNYPGIRITVYGICRFDIRSFTGPFDIFRCVLPPFAAESFPD